MAQHIIAVSDEVSLCYETFGDPRDPALLLVMGLGVQLISWEPEFCEAFAREGFYVVRYDNRDVGRSSSVPTGSYTFSDMARDGIDLLTALGIESAHVMGVSMGGMIAQTMAIEHPDRVLTLCSVMSNTGAPGVNQATPEAIEIISRTRAVSRDETIAEAVERGRFCAGTAFPFDEERIRRRAESSYDRAHYPEGKARHVRAARAAADRTEGLRAVTAPTLVVHGEADPISTVSGGLATAAAVPGSRLRIIPDMGHEIPQGLEETLIREVVDNARRGGFKGAVARS